MGVFDIYTTFIRPQPFTFVIVTRVYYNRYLSAPLFLGSTILVQFTDFNVIKCQEDWTGAATDVTKFPTTSMLQHVCDLASQQVHAGRLCTTFMCHRSSRIRSISKATSRFEFRSFLVDLLFLSCLKRKSKCLVYSFITVSQGLSIIIRLNSSILGNITLYLLLYFRWIRSHVSLIQFICCTVEFH